MPRGNPFWRKGVSRPSPVSSTLATELRVRSPLLDLVESELAFRQAAHRKAEILAIEASRGLQDHHLLVRANVRAGQSAHLDGRDQEAITHHRRAQSAARTKPDKREALWGEFVCSIDLETKDSFAVLGRLEALGSDGASDEIRLANGHMLLAMRAGSGIDPEWLSAVYRLSRVDDPLIRSSFLQVWSSLLTYTGTLRRGARCGRATTSRGRSKPTCLCEATCPDSASDCAKGIEAISGSS